MLDLKVLHVTLTREGQVNWMVSGDHHCGLDVAVVQGVLPVKYTVVAKCKNKLDHRGFLFDQATADAWIAEMAKHNTVQSCEKIAESVGRRLLLKISKAFPQVEIEELTVVISPAPFAAKITAEFGQ